MRIFRIVAWISLLLGISAAWGQNPACEGPTAPDAKHPPERLDGATSYVYKRAGDLELRLHVFSPSRPSATGSPAIVIFSGGGWKWTSVSSSVPLAEHLAAKGMVAILPDYRVLCRGNADIAEEITDGKSAVRWVRAHARELGVDPDKIAASGGSSGAHIALSTAVLDGFDDASEDRKISSRPDLLVLYYPCVDPTSKEELEYSAAVLGSHGEDVAPAHQVRKGQPPMIVLQGTADTLYSNSKNYCEALNAAGNRCDFVEFDGAPHGFANPARQEKELVEESLSYVDRFLEDEGYLNNRAASR